MSGMCMYQFLMCFHVRLLLIARQMFHDPLLFFCGVQYPVSDTWCLHLQAGGSSSRDAEGVTVNQSKQTGVRGWRGWWINSDVDWMLKYIIGVYACEMWMIYAQNIITGMAAVTFDGVKISYNVACCIVWKSHESWLVILL